MTNVDHQESFATTTYVSKRTTMAAFERFVPSTFVGRFDRLRLTSSGRDLDHGASKLNEVVLMEIECTQTQRAPACREERCRVTWSGSEVH